MGLILAPALTLALTLTLNHSPSPHPNPHPHSQVLREGMGQSSFASADEALDLVVTNALIIDAKLGVIKADIGVKGGRIVGIGKAGNPDVMAGVTPGMVTGVTTEALAGEKLIVTAGGIDTHVHYICPQLIDEALASGVTTLYGGGTGPNHGTLATTCTPAPDQIKMMMQATDTLDLTLTPNLTLNLTPNPNT